MALRVCADLNCPTLISASARDGRCVVHRRALDAARGRRQSRGYDAEYDAERRRWAPIVATGTVPCRRARSGHCLERDRFIHADQQWNLGHPDAEVPDPLAPEHRGCNLATGRPGR